MAKYLATPFILPRRQLLVMANAALAAAAARIYVADFLPSTQDIFRRGRVVSRRRTPEAASLKTVRFAGGRR